VDHPAGRAQWIEWALLCGPGLVVAYLELFRVLNWGAGIWRALLLVGLATGALLLLARAPAGREPAVPKVLLAAAALALIVDLASGVRAVIHTIEVQEIEMDQGQNTFRALEYLRQGANPYGRTAMLDPVSHNELGQLLSKQPGCLAQPMSPESSAALTRYWARVDAKATAAFLPVLRDTPSCQPFATLAASLGYKYGPALLAGYLPFVFTFGKPGIFVAHLTLLLLAVLLFSWFGRTRGASWAVIAGALVLLLAPSHLRHNILKLSAGDGGPTLAAAAGLMLLLRGRHGWAALFIGLSVACKSLPGLLYAPLLLACPRRTWALFLLPILAAYLPFLAWDTTGFVNNIVLYHEGRLADSTALAYFLGRSWLVAVQVVGLAAMVLALARARKRQWSASSLLSYLWIAHAAILLGAAVFHNNYLLWLLPLLALSFLFALARPRSNDSP
jgi:hypothetical protein